uniref:Ubiquitin carboxyl-terminal hydrolase 1 n=2 Tax=Ceratitis capitata TaxID=7213 RepID=W8BX22_CERCA
MPRNAAKKLSNDEVCLPIQTVKVIAETIIEISSKNDLIQNSTPTISTITQQQQQQPSKQINLEEKPKAQQQLQLEQKELQQQQQPTQQAKKSRRSRRKRRNRQISKKRKSTKENATIESGNTERKSSEENPVATQNSSKSPSKLPAFRKRRYTPTYYPTLYPVVIETCVELVDNQTANASTKAATTGSNSTASAGGVVGTSRASFGAGGSRRTLRRRRSVTNFTKRKNKAKAKGKAGPKEAATTALKGLKSKETVERLATLRNRKKLEEILKAKKRQNQAASKGGSGREQVKRHPAWFNLDETLLSKIETLEVEVKKVGTKRKRDSSVAAARKRNCNTHKHTPPPSAAQLPPTNFDFAALHCSGVPAAENIATPSINIAPGDSEVVSRAPVSSKPLEITAEVPVGAVTTTSTATATISANSTTPTTSGNVKKRGRGIMSLYDRRYQTTTDGEARASSGSVTNGYLSSTRTSSASSSAVHSDVENAQDISQQQFYMPVASASSGGLTVSSSSGSGGIVAATQLGNGNTLNHAPSMATLCNIGNTCYLNSVVYTLRFAPRFLHNLHHLIVDLSSIQQCIARQRAAKSSSLGRGISAVQLENARSFSSKDLAALEQNALMSTGGGGIGQKSSHQMLTERLHELYQCLHRNEVAESTEPFHADTLLHAVQDVNAIFEGNQQQDAHEFLMCLLNSIRETCQLLIKAISEYPDLIINGYIRNPDELDAYTLDRDTLSGTTSNNNAVGSGNSAATTVATSSSLSTSSIPKSSFFSRKSKRKDESKNSKNTRIQSPLKDGQSGNGLQATANSLFYLNSVDLSSAPPSNATATSNAAASSPNAVIKGLSGNESSSELSSPVSMLKDKERLAEKIRELGLDFFSEDFEGVTVSSTKCLSCETVTEQKESMIDIAVPVPISGYDNSDYTDKPSSFIQNSCVTREFFRGENKYRCEQCTGYTEAIRSISYEVLPRLLVIQLSRFSGGMEKINSYIPTSFTLQCFCAKCCELSDANKLHIYKLYSVITHVGATMSVGHYIAYTCSLDWANEYINCPKDRRNNSNNSLQQTNGLSNNSLYPLGGGSAASGGGSTPNERSSPGAQAASAASAAASVLASSGSSLMKKMKFGRSKASSSGDMSKNMKNLNGITSKAITNGIGKLSMNTTCHSLTCCATRICSVHQQQQLQQQQQQLSGSNNELSEETLQNGTNLASSSMSISGSSSNTGGVGAGVAGGSGTISGGSSTTSGYNSYPAGYGSTGRGGTKAGSTFSGNGGGGGYASSCGSLSAAAAAGGSNHGEPIWYMCDDDKIKAMTQREFEELLSPARKITVTPYLLFYARFDLQTSTPPSAKSTSTTSTAQSSLWSNENLAPQPGATAAALHKM